MATPSEFVTARWLFPSEGAPIPNAKVTIVDGIIQQIESQPLLPSESVPGASSGQNVAIIPALVNAHTHLEFSNLDEPVGKGAESFADWIRSVLAQRATSSCPSSSIQAGLRESLAAGVRLIGEIATSATDANQPLPLAGVRFFELIGISAERQRESLQLARSFLTSDDNHRSMSNLQSEWTAGLSPHAPYTTSFALVEEAVKLANEHAAPVAMHLAETKEELELLASHSGPLRELLDERSLFDPTAFPLNTKPLDYLRRLAEVEKRCLVIHGNYLDRQELEFLAEHDDKMTLVYCPRTHSFFRHEKYPLRQALELGVNVALGTDSRASNPDLSLFADLQHAALQHPEVNPQQLLAAATNQRALGRSGQLTVGQPADFTLVDLPQHWETDDPFELLIRSGSNPRKRDR